MNTQSFLSHMQSVTWYLSVPGYVFPQKIWSSLSLPECPKLSINRKWFSNNWKKKKKNSSWKFKKSVWIFSQESDCQIWILRKGYVEQQLDGVFHAAVGTKVKADDATLRFFCAFIWFRLMVFFFFFSWILICLNWIASSCCFLEFPGSWIDLVLVCNEKLFFGYSFWSLAFWNFLVLVCYWFLFTRLLNFV